MGIFEPLIEHSDGKPPEPRHPLDVVAPILVLLLAVALLVWAAKSKHHGNLAWLLLFA